MIQMKITSRELYSFDRRYQLIYEGIYKGIKYFIISYGTHPCAYIENVWNFKSYDDERLDDISVHYGFTFLGEKERTNCLGWDYAHFNDHFEYRSITPARHSGVRRWMCEDILKEIKDVINQMIEKFGKGEL